MDTSIDIGYEEPKKSNDKCKNIIRILLAIVFNFISLLVMIYFYNYLITDEICEELKGTKVVLLCIACITGNAFFTLFSNIAVISQLSKTIASISVMYNKILILFVFTNQFSICSHMFFRIYYVCPFMMIATKADGGYVFGFMALIMYLFQFGLIIKLIIDIINNN